MKMKKRNKLHLLAFMLVAALMMTVATPTVSARADDETAFANLDLIDDEPHEIGGGAYNVGGTGGNALSNDALVVRGGLSTPSTLVANQASDSRGYISANSANGVGLSTLATTPTSFPNGQITVTTVGEIRAIGMDVIPDSTSTNPYHAAIVPKGNSLSTGDALRLSNTFHKQFNA